MSFPSTVRRARSLLPRVLLLLVAAPLGACGLLRTAANAPTEIANSMTGKGKAPADALPPNVLQGGVMRFADTFAATITQATGDFARAAGTPEAQIQALSWSVGQNTAAFSIATGPNARVDLLDMIVLVTLGRMTHEEYWGPKVWGEADRPMQVAFTQLEGQIWEIAKLALTEQQQSDLRATMVDWRETHPDMGVTATVRLPLFEDLLANSKLQKEKGAGGLGDLLSLDPFAGLEPTLQKMEQLRLIAERGLYYSQRIPLVFSTQIELLGLRLMRMPGIQSALADSERVSKAAASVAETAARLPDELHAEREAAVRQIADELSAQRQGLVADIERAGAPARELLAQAHTTLDAGTQLSVALKSTVESFDTLMERFAPKSAPGASAPSSATEPSHPFLVSEYGEAATHLGAASRELTELITTLDKSLPQVQRVLDESAARADRSLERALDRALLYGALLIVGAAFATLLVRWLSRRWLGARPAA
jgi:hypothetical protein